MTERDRFRARVYAVEDQVSKLLDRSSASHRVEFLGSNLTLPVERRFGDVPSVQRYVDLLLGMPQVVSRWPELPPCGVRPRRGERAAHYEPPGVIAVPPDAQWAMREMVICHEVSHHVVWHGIGAGRARHGVEFIDTMAVLCDVAMAPEVGFLLRAGYADAGIGRRSQAGAVGQ